MALFRQWWVRRGHKSVDGGYVHYPLADLLGVVALESRRQECLVVGEDLGVVPDEIRKALPEFGVFHYKVVLFEQKNGEFVAPADYVRPALAGRDFMMPWNIAREFWPLYDQPPDQRPLYPFNAEPINEFINKYKGAREVPIFDSQLVIPVIYLNDVPAFLKEGSPSLRYLRETHTPFMVLINYGSAQMSEAEGQAIWKLLNGELRDQFLGWISGESVGYVWDHAAAELQVTPQMSRAELLEAHRVFYTNAIARKWEQTFHTPTGAMWNKMIPVTGSTSMAGWNWLLLV